jgi:hypothetical protein
MVTHHDFGINDKGEAWIPTGFVQEQQPRNILILEHIQYTIIAPDMVPFTFIPPGNLPRPFIGTRWTSPKMPWYAFETDHKVRFAPGHQGSIRVLCMWYGLQGH